LLGLLSLFSISTERTTWHRTYFPAETAPYDEIQSFTQLRGSCCVRSDNNRTGDRSSYFLHVPAPALWRLPVLEPIIAQVTLAHLIKVLTLTSESVASSPRATMLTLLRLAMNAIGTLLCYRSWLATLGRGPRPQVCSYRRSFTRIDSCRWPLRAWRLMSALGCRRVELRGSRGTMRWVAFVRAERAEGGRWNW